MPLEWLRTGMVADANRNPSASPLVAPPGGSAAMLPSSRPAGVGRDEASPEPQKPFRAALGVRDSLPNMLRSIPLTPMAPTLHEDQMTCCGSSLING